MQVDIRATALYLEAEDVYRALWQPGTGRICDAAQLHVSPNGERAVFAGTIMDRLEGTPPTRICEVDLTSGSVRILTSGPNADCHPKYSPDGRHVAFLSDRQRAGDFQLYLLDLVSGVVHAKSPVEGWIEYLHWSPDGKRLLLGVAGHGADIAGGQGAVTSPRTGIEVPSWMPVVETGKEDYRWRRTWVHEVATDNVRQVSAAESNIWEAVWCGNESLIAVVSPGAAEGLWYSARLHMVDIGTGRSREVYIPRDQLGWPAASPSGNRLAIVEAACSDRWLVAGDLLLIDTRTGQIQRVDTEGASITYSEWRTERSLLLAGYRGFETVVGMYDLDSGSFNEVWSSQEISTRGFISVSPLKERGGFALIGEGFVRGPEIAVVLQGDYRPVTSFGLAYVDHVRAIDKVDSVRWRAPDGLEIQGWLLRPKGDAPHPLVMNLHGGPIWHWRPHWLGRSRGVPILMLLKHGYAVFLPNPRGSSGRGQEFARRVLGDMGGADTSDYLSGLDHLVKEGVADSTRLGVTGISYGGFMASWLLTQDARFAAAVPVAPHTNQVTEHLLSNIPQFMELFLADHYDNPAGKYFERSPVMYANRVKTPTLNICGALDRCTPPEEAKQFHNALLRNSVKSVLVTYPEEGHGVRHFPASIDYAARVVAWFQEHMPAGYQTR